MMATYEIPLDPGAQSFSVNLGGVQYKFRLIYRNAVGGGWFLDMEKADGTDGILGIPLLVGIDLLAQHAHKGFGHLMATMESGKSGHPTYEDMGSALHLFWSNEGWGEQTGSDTSS